MTDNDNKCRCGKDMDDCCKNGSGAREKEENCNCEQNSNVCACGSAGSCCRE